MRSASINQRSHISCDPQPSGKGCFFSLIILFFILAGLPADAADKKPNILVIWGDDVGISNISAYSDGLMGYQTPNIDRLAKEGIRFLHYYGEQSSAGPA